ncbi:hypothetical protein [Roseateles sp.]|uniref:hypothetical protein n=1 Tax=Roseateles sp. TaxID=1971397 RepID=UPI0031D8927E
MIVMQLLLAAVALLYGTLYWLTGEPDGWEVLMSYKNHDRMAAGWTRVKWIGWGLLAAFDAAMWPFVWELLTK